MTQDPIERFKESLARWKATGFALYDAAALATAGNDGMPSVRVVLLKNVDSRGFVFYTNLESQKGRELAANPKASLCFWWWELHEQVRIEGTVERVSDEEADAYFATRERGSQIGAWASRQSEALASRRELEDAFAEFDEKYKDAPIPRPPYWSGYRLAPERIEFWHGKADRLHERYLYTRTPSGWDVTILYP